MKKTILFDFNLIFNLNKKSLGRQICPDEFFFFFYFFKTGKGKEGFKAKLESKMGPRSKMRSHALMHEV